MKKDKKEYKVKQEHWYEMYYSECVLCGRNEDHKERRYGEKPKDLNKVYHYEQYACGQHFC